MKKLIAITGGIGSGKSFAIDILKECGFNTLSCDDFTKDAYLDKDVKEFLISEFNSTKKDIIKKTAFLDETKYAKMTDIVTKKVFELTMNKAKTFDGITFVEVPLLFEFNYQDNFDNVIVICRDKNERIESVVKRSKISESDVLLRISKQFDYETADLSKYFVIKNNGDREKLKQDILSLIEKLR